MRGQLREIIRQFPEIQKSAKAAKDSADLSRRALDDAAKNFRVDERAWLAPEFTKEPMPKKPLGMAICNLGIVNSGKTQALRVRGEIMAAVIPAWTKRFPFDSARTTPFSPTVIYPSKPTQTYGIPVLRQLKNGRWGGVTWDEIVGNASV